MIEFPCQHIALRRDDSLRFTRTQPKRPAWLVLLWQAGHLTGWIQSRPSSDAAGLVLMLGAIWQHNRDHWPLRRPQCLRVDGDALQRMPDLPYMLGAGKDFEVVETADLPVQGSEQIAAFENFWVEVSNMLHLWDVHSLTAGDTADLATEFGVIIPSGPTLWDTLRREDSVRELAREIAMERRS